MSKRAAVKAAHVEETDRRVRAVDVAPQIGEPAAVGRPRQHRLLIEVARQARVVRAVGADAVQVLPPLAEARVGQPLAVGRPRGGAHSLGVLDDRVRSGAVGVRDDQPSRSTSGVDKGESAPVWRPRGHGRLRDPHLPSRPQVEHHEANCGARRRLCRVRKPALVRRPHRRSEVGADICDSNRSGVAAIPVHEPDVMTSSIGDQLSVR